MKFKQGFIALIIVLTVSAIALVISSTILLKSITEARISLDEESSNQAWAAVNACGETALGALVGTSTAWNNYTATANVSVGANSCYYITSGTGTSTARLINASSSVNSFVRKLSITVATNTPAVSVSAWSLVADF